MTSYRSRGIETHGAERAIIYSDGATFTLATRARSHYDGLICQRSDKNGFRAIKLLDSIEFEAGAIERISCEPRSLIVEHEDGLIVTYALESTSRSTTLTIRTSRPATGVLRFDIRHVYDSQPFHKHYTLEDLNARGARAYTLAFAKESVGDTRYDITETIRFGLYGTNVGDEKTDQWTVIEDGFDARRNGTEANHHVYEPVRFTECETIIITTKTRLAPTGETPRAEAVGSKRELVRIAATEQLEGSVLTRGSAKHVLAGFPWFFQEWSRDTAMSIGGMRSILSTSERINILLRLARSLHESEASIQSDPTSLRTADAMGLVMWRLSEEELSPQKRKTIAKILEDHLHALDTRIQDGLLTSGERETWMDTMPGWRAGACIEIQALYARMLGFAFTLTGYNHYADQRARFIERVRHSFIGEDGRIIDHRDPDGVPFTYATNNAFLAYVVEPELFEEGTWVWTFDEWLTRLSTPEQPGIIFSLEERSPLFRPYHEGASDASYHRGDSWLFMNHLTALALHRLDRERYQDRVEAIIEAAVRDSLELGAFLGLSEVSSAHSQDSNGCWAQTWSAATLLELFDELER
ncbi:MAG: amylo-alpha-1,6-glucosidase [Candidatus Woesearchaeota archaeon]